MRFFYEKYFCGFLIQKGYLRMNCMYMLIISHLFCEAESINTEVNFLKDFVPQILQKFSYRPKNPHTLS